MEPQSAPTIRQDLGALLRMAVRHHQQGRLEEAGAIYRQILAACPAQPDALHLLGRVEHAQGRYHEAEALLRRAVAADPRQATFHHNLGEALRAMDKHAEACRAFETAVRIKPDYPLARLHWAQGLVAQGQFALAEPMLREVIRLDPGSAVAHFTLAFLLQASGRLAEALAALEAALRIEPNDVGALTNMGAIYFNLARFDEAVDVLRRAVRIDGTIASAHCNLGSALHGQGLLEEEIASFRAACRLEPGNALFGSNLLYALNFAPQHDAAFLYAEHRLWGERHADGLAAASAAHGNQRLADRRLRVGYVSAHFWSHAVHFFVEPILRCHDHQAFQVFCYSNTPRADEDATTQRLRGYADHWQSIEHLSDQQAADMIRQDQIDILVDLTGHIGGSRLLLFARKPAPVQVTYIGYQNTTGMLAMDYRLTDDWADPPGMTDRYYTERLVRLPGTFFCYQPTSDAPPVGPLPALANGFVTFGSFNNFAKVTPQVLSAWAQLLRAVPDSRLVVLARVTKRLQEYVYATLAEQGIDKARVELCSWLPRQKYLELIASTDVALDAFPFNGHTTTCDALWQGVPVVTLAGDSYVSRFGSSAHQNLGLQDLVASSVEQYIEIAAKLAQDTPRLAELRASLRERMSASPILDHRQFTRNLEAAYRQMWLDWCQRPAST